MAFLTVSLALGLSALAAASPLQLNIQTPSWAQTETYHDLAGTVSDLGTVGNYTIVPAIWVGQIRPSQPAITIRGRTIESILTYVQTLNPTLQPFIAEPAVEAISKIQAEDGVARFTHDCGFGGYPCFMQCHRNNFGKGRVSALNEAMDYLRSHWPAGSLAHVYGGAGSCFQVTCSWDSALFYCNDVSLSFTYSKPK
jgi:hypothetical protein